MGIGTFLSPDAPYCAVDLADTTYIHPSGGVLEGATPSEQTIGTPEIFVVCLRWLVACALFEGAERSMWMVRCKTGRRSRL